MGSWGHWGVLGGPSGGKIRKKGSQQRAKIEANRVKREPKGGQNGSKMRSKFDLGSQWGPRAGKRDPKGPPRRPTVVFSRVPLTPGRSKHSKSDIRYFKNRCWRFFLCFFAFQNSIKKTRTRKTP